MKVTGEYESCGDNSDESKLCQCAVYVRLNDSNPSYAFIDHCGASKIINNRFRYFDNSLKDDLRKNDNLPLLACDSSLINENDESEWSKIPLEKSYFKCAKLINSPCNENYVVCTHFIYE